MKKLLNKKINKIIINDKYTEMLFVCEDGEEIGFYTEGDCCSTSWFQHINNLNNLLGQKVIEVIEKKGAGREATEKEYKEIKPNDPEYGSYESLEVYMYTLKTPKGYTDIEFRNDSNGYYGGSCVETEISGTDKAKMSEVRKDF